MPSTFRTFLQSKKAQPDPTFNERDESHFVAALLMLRLGFQGTLGHAAFDTVATLAENTDDPLASIVRGPETASALIFVSTFLCFFVVKPKAFMQAVGQFKQHFIPGFADDVSKRIQLFELANPTFSEAQPDATQWTSLGNFFRTWQKEEQVREPAEHY